MLIHLRSGGLNLRNALLGRVFTTKKPTCQSLRDATKYLESHSLHLEAASRGTFNGGISYDLLSMNMIVTYDVLIAGAGPVGLFLASELRLAGASVLLLEKNPASSTPLKSGWMGARGLNFPSTEAFYRRGLLDEVKVASFGWMGGERPGMEFKGDGTAPPPPASAPRFVGHFAGIMLDASKVDFSSHKWIIPGPSVGGGMVSLEALEDVLAQRARKLGGEIRLGQEVIGLTETADGISVQTGSDQFDAKWLVGCDGGRSSVRRLAGFEFDGTEPELTAILRLSNLRISRIWRQVSTLRRAGYTPTARPQAASVSSISMAAASIEPQRLLAKTCRRCCNMSPEQR
jgi:hypothetical protein